MITIIAIITIITSITIVMVIVTIIMIFCINKYTLFWTAEAQCFAQRLRSSWNAGHGGGVFAKGIMFVFKVWGFRD